MTPHFLRSFSRTSPSSVFAAHLILVCLLGILPFSSQAQSENSPEPSAAELQLKKLQEENALLRDQLSQTAARANKLENRLAKIEAERTAVNPPASDDTPPEVEKTSLWTAEIALGADYSSGNNDSAAIAAGVKAVRTTEIDKLTLEARADFAQNESVSIRERLLGLADYKRDLSEDWYWYARGELDRDVIAGVNWRANVGPGLGWHIIKNDKMALSLEGGPTWVAEDLIGATLSHSVRARLAQNFEWQFSEYAKIYESVQIIDNLQDISDWLLIAEVGIESDLTKSLSLRVSAENRYDNRPAAGRDKNDLFLQSSIIYKFD
ncbi:MAG: DUF481 domain-containing protein [Verrucomicrobiota bacterium]